MNDILVIGGGIVGLSTAYALSQRFPTVKITVVEKEKAWAMHQTGNNSGVIHSGIYYKPGSYKAKFARAGSQKIIQFSKQFGINFEQCGKVIVAIKEKELPLLDNLYKRGQENKLAIQMLSQAELKEVEPHVNGLRAIKVPQAGIIDYAQVCETIVSQLTEHGAELHLNIEVKKVIEHGDHVELITNGSTFKAKYMVNCTGLHSDRVTKSSGVQTDVKIIPFRGEYYELKADKQNLVKNLIYPVPNPDFPFLGVHFTRMINGGVEAGPNAVLSLKREGYKKTDINLKDFAEVIGYKGFWKLASKYWKEGMNEYVRSFSKKAFVKSLQELIPEVQEGDLQAAPAGVRAQALKSDGSLVNDFYFVSGKRSIHVCNSPSPAATACLSIGEEVTRVLEKIHSPTFNQ